MVAHEVSKPVRPLLRRDGQVILEDLESKRLQVVQRADRNVGDGMPAEDMRNVSVGHVF